MCNRVIVFGRVLQVFVNLTLGSELRNKNFDNVSDNRTAITVLILKEQNNSSQIGKPINLFHNLISERNLKNATERDCV